MTQGLPSQLSDPIWRIQNLYLIRDKRRQRRRMVLNACQRRILAAIRPALDSRRPVRHFDLKYRQGGVSTFWLLYYLDDTIFTPNTSSAILAQEQDTLNFLWDVIRFAHSSMPPSLRPPLLKDNAKTLSFPNGSRIMVALHVNGTGLHNLHVSEYPKCNPVEIEETIAACPPWANATLEGVGEGMNHAHEKWVAHGDGYTRLFHPWFLQEEYRLETPPLERTEEERRLAAYALREYGVSLDDRQFAYRRRMKKELRERYPALMAEDPITCFISSGNRFFNGLKMATLLEEARQELEKNPPLKKDDELEIWELPQPRHVYAAGADVAEGVSGDYSVLAILCVTCRKTAMRYRARCATDYFHRLCHKYGVECNNALLAPENNGLGLAVVQGLKENGYPNLYREKQDTRLNSLKDYLKFGWDTNVQTKPVMMDNLRLALEGKFEEDENNFHPEFMVLDTKFLEETLNISERGGKIQAESGKHDDLVMAYAIAFQMYLRLKRTRLDLGDWFVGGKRDSAED